MFESSPIVPYTTHSPFPTKNLYEHKDYHYKTLSDNQKRFTDQEFQTFRI